MEKIKLPAEDIANLRAAERDLHDLLPEMDKGEECGIDCKEYRSIISDARDRIAALLKNYS